jgi:hypothetical protein
VTYPGTPFIVFNRFDRRAPFLGPSPIQQQPKTKGMEVPNSRLQAGAMICLALLSWTRSANADGPQPIGSGQPASDPKNFVGDRVTFFTNFIAKKVDYSKQTAAPITDVCVPAGTIAHGQNPITIQTPAGTSAGASGTAASGAAGTTSSASTTSTTSTPLTFFVNAVGTPTATSTASPAIPASAATATTAICGSNIPSVKAGDVVLVDPTVIGQLPYHRQGFVYGTLLVPFKYHFHSHSFTSSASVAPYLGWQSLDNGNDPTKPKDSPWPPLQYVLFAGASITPVAGSNSDGSSQTFAGFSYGMGILTTIKDSFHGGLVVGWDKVNASAKYADNNRPWISLELGFNFSN